jgi:hypothetical protein
MDVVNEIVMLPAAAIKPYHRNVRKNRETIDRLCQLVPKVGFNQPILLDRNNVIVKGHTRWAVAIRLGMEQIPCVYSKNDDETNKLDRLADNKVQEFSTWDTEALLSELTSINLDFDFKILDFDIEIPDVDIPEITVNIKENCTTAPESGEAVLEASAPNISPQAQPEADISEEPFITPEDVQKTLPKMMNDYAEVVCDKCGNRMFIRRA